MNTLDTKKRKFRPGKLLTIFYIVFVMLFIYLGMWQIDRGNEKTQMISEFELNKSKKPQSLSNNSKKWERIYVKGTWDSSRQMLLDNVIHNGRSGLKVITPILIEDKNEIVLVDRGWIERPINRAKLPNINIQDKLVTISGILKSPELGLILSDELISESWPKIIQTSNIEIISSEFNEKVFPFLLIADPLFNESLDYIELKPTTMLPEKHYGYAITWFTMGIILTAMFMLRGFRNEK